MEKSGPSEEDIENFGKSVSEGYAGLRLGVDGRLLCIVIVLASVLVYVAKEYVSVTLSLVFEGCKLMCESCSVISVVANAECCSRLTRESCSAISAVAISEGDFAGMQAGPAQWSSIGTRSGSVKPSAEDEKWLNPSILAVVRVSDM